MTEPLFWLAPVAALTALLFAALFFQTMRRQDEGTPLMRRIGGVPSEPCHAHDAVVLGKVGL